MTAKKKRPDLATLLHTKPSVVTEYLARHGRKGDKFLAHINRREAAMLKAAGGSGKVNPNTGIMEFDDTGFDYNALGDAQQGSFDAPVNEIVQEYQPTPYQAGSDTSFQYAPSSTDASGGVNVGEGVTPQAFQAGGGYSMNPYAGGATPFTGSPAVGQQAAFNTLSPYAPGSQALGKEAAAVAPEGVKPAAATPEKQGWLDKNKGWAIPGALGLIGAGAGMMQNKAMQQQAKGVQGQYQAMAAPYQQAGQQLLSMTQSGGLTPANTQILQAAQARANQQAAGGGGVAQAQANQQLAAIAAQLQQHQMSQAYQMMAIGDNIAMGGIQAGMQADQMARQTNAQFYSTLAQMVASMRF